MSGMDAEGVHYFANLFKLTKLVVRPTMAVSDQ
jgi:hypothetical protein